MTAAPDPALPLVAIVGRPNVGKSTLYNRLAGGREALTHDRPGITRDLRYGTLSHDGRELALVDTGGLDLEVARRHGKSLPAAIHRMASRAIDEAALVIFLIDGEAGVVPADAEIARDLRHRGKRVLFVANKVDSARREGFESELFALGAERAFGVSAAHGRGLTDLCDAIVEELALPARVAVDEEQGEEEEAGDEQSAKRAALVRGPIRLAIVGRPNAGKSSLTNRLLGQDRVVVHEEAGTTMDSVDTPLSYGGRDYVLIDTAGIRRGRSVADTPEIVASQKALDAIGRSDVVVVAIDALAGPTEQDSRIAGYAEGKGRAVLLVLTKWDLVIGRAPEAGEDAELDPARRLRQRLRDEMPHVTWAPILITSSASGRGVERILEAAATAYGQYTRHIATAELNRFFEGVLAHHPPPAQQGRPTRLYYITQPAIKPPAFVVSASAPALVSHSYRRYLVNQLREEFGFAGTSLRLSCMRRERKRSGRR